MPATAGRSDIHNIIIYSKAGCHGSTTAVDTNAMMTSRVATHLRAFALHTAQLRGHDHVDGVT